MGTSFILLKYQIIPVVIAENSDRIKNTKGHKIVLTYISQADIFIKLLI